MEIPEHNSLQLNAYTGKNFRITLQKLKDNSTGEVDPNGGSQTFVGQFIDGDVNFFSRDANSGIRPLSGNLIGTLSVGTDGSSNDNDFATYVEKVWSWQDSSDTSLYFNNQSLTDSSNGVYVSVDSQGGWEANSSNVRKPYVLQKGGASIYVQPVDQLVAETDTAIFEVKARGAGVVTYQWQRNGENIPGATSDIYVIPSVFGDQNGDEFRVIVTAGGISVASDIVTLEVQLPQNQFTILKANGSELNPYPGTTALDFEFIHDIGMFPEMRGTVFLPINDTNIIIQARLRWSFFLEMIQ